ncbi:glycosyltransferase family 39 protein [Hymenobacter sp. DG01]|uniref:glycosyltransferase family 39 protein n=1 Tax=Hymenobacter sp. DG01 TaxID=2584940 RepID=UPI0011205E35|nr:glycosyltransferase family 39 protein [Hymenobacter sp. DG01]
MKDLIPAPDLSTRNGRLATRVGLFSLIALFILVAGYQVNRQGFWHDEMYTLSFIRGFDIYLFSGSDLQETSLHPVQWYQQYLHQDLYWQKFWRNIVHEGHPPLYYLLLKLWTYVAGYDETGLRSFSIAASVLSLVVAFNIGALFNRRFALLYTGLLACCPLFLFYALEARMYALYVLLALGCFYWFLVLLRPTTTSNVKPLFWFVITGILLLYTHYYGVFVYGVLALTIGIGFFRQQRWLPFISLGLPVLTLLPWVPIIQQQTAAHKVHWTNGYLGFAPSLQQFVKGSTELLTAPFQEQSAYEFYVLYGVAVLLVVNMRLTKRRLRTSLLWGGAAILLYGIGIIVFDKALNHHTIAVPRYYLPLQFVLLFAIAVLIDTGRSKWLSWLATIVLFGMFAKIQVDLLTTMREAKQMYRQVGGYLSQQYDPAQAEVVVSPNGPSAVAVAYYASKNFVLHTMPATQVCEQYTKPRVVVVEQRLGLASEPWMLPCKNATQDGRIVRFVGVDVVNEK